MGCSSSQAIQSSPIQDKSYIRPLKRFNLSFSVNIPNKAVMERIHDYTAWSRFLVHAMQMALHNEWEEAHGPSLDFMNEVPCDNLEVSLLRNRRGYSGVVAWTSLDCGRKYVAEYIAESIISTPVGLNSPFRALSIHPHDLWTDDEDYPTEEVVAAESDPAPLKN